MNISANINNHLHCHYIIDINQYQKLLDKLALLVVLLASIVNPENIIEPIFALY